MQNFGSSGFSWVVTIEQDESHENFYDDDDDQKQQVLWFVDFCVHDIVILM